MSTKGPLSVSQEQIWYVEQLTPGLGLYNETMSVHIDEAVDVEALRWAVRQLPERHDAWRATFAVEDGRPVQRIAATAALDVPLHDLAALPAEEAESAAATLLRSLTAPAYDLATGPLVRAAVLAMPAGRRRVIFAFHHLVFDGVTLHAVILPDLVALYRCRVAGTEQPPLTEGSYLEFAAWQQEWITSPAARKRVLWWTKRLAGAEPLDLPLDRARPPLLTFGGSRLPVDIPAAVTAALRETAVARGATFFQALAATYALTLSVACAQEDVVFGTVADLRSRPSFTRVAGYAITPLVLRTDLSGDPSFAALLGRVRGDLLDALDHAVPFERVVRALKAPRDPSVNPVFQAALMLQPVTPEIAPGWGVVGLEATSETDTGLAKFDLNLELDERREGGLRGRFGFNTALFDEATAVRLLDLWERVIVAVTAEPETPVSRLGLVPRPEILPAAVGESRPDLLERIDKVVANAPDAVAVTWHGTDTTYAALEAEAGVLRARLAAAGVGAGDVVAVCLDRSPRLLAAMLAVARAGATYLPVDPAYPAARIAYMLDDAGVRVAVTDHPELCAGRVVLRPGEGDAEPLDAPEVPGSTPLYVLYTSGSTGRPKGVAIPRDAVSALVTAFGATPGLQAGQSVLAITTVSFDISVLELWWPLAAGARIVLADREETADGRLLRPLAEQADLIQATPASWQLLLDAGWEGSATLTALCGGERLAPELAAQLLPRVGSLWNCYGPTETTVWSTVAQVTDAADVTIGTAIPGTTTSVVGADGGHVFPGARGELVIGGAGVMAGYLNRPELNAEKLVDDPAAPGRLAYRTGDLVRVGSDGRLRHLGRADGQIKVRGFRIEPGEVESALLRDPSVEAAVVVGREDRLVGYVVPAGGTLDEAALLADLRETLPPQLVPTTLVRIEAVPRTANGKVDRNALPDPGGETALASEPPLPGLESELAAVYAAVLNLGSIGRRDDFFALGGHSLLAARLVIQLEKATDRSIPLAHMVHGGATVAGMAALLTQPEPQAASASPLFVIYPSEESVMSMRHLLPALPTETIGLLPLLKRGRFDLAGSVEELAAELVTQVRARQPQGPYLLAGYSFGGLLAYEVARLLLARGERVGWLGLLDAVTPEAMREIAGKRLGMAPRDRVTAALAGGVPQLFRELRIRTPFLPAPAGMFDWHGAEVLAGRYVCDPVRTEVHFFSPSEEVEEIAAMVGGWRRRHPDSLTVHPVPGGHLTMVQPPHVAGLGAAMAASLRSALPA